MCRHFHAVDNEQFSPWLNQTLLTFVSFKLPLPFLPPPNRPGWGEARAGSCSIVCWTSSLAPQRWSLIYSPTQFVSDLLLHVSRPVFFFVHFLLAEAVDELMNPLTED